jgi:hypothetical protein
MKNTQSSMEVSSGCSGKRETKGEQSYGDGLMQVKTLRFR